MQFDFVNSRVCSSWKDGADVVERLRGDSDIVVLGLSCSGKSCGQKKLQCYSEYVSNEEERTVRSDAISCPKKNRALVLDRILWFFFFFFLDEIGGTLECKVDILGCAVQDLLS